VRKWWYRQLLLDDKLEFRIGRNQSHNDIFDVSLFANHEDKDILNNMSSRNPTIPHSNGMGAFVGIRPADWIYFHAAAIDAQVVNRTKTGFDTGFHDEAWFNAFWELGFTPAWKTERGKMPGRYRIGWWYDPRVEPIFMNTLNGRRRQRFRGNDVGFYLGADQTVWLEPGRPDTDQGLGLFARLGLAHQDINRVSRYWQVGASYKGLIRGRDKDVTAFAVSQAILSRQFREKVREDADRETVYEWYYQIQLTPSCTIAPHVQVVQNPGGGKSDRDAIIGGIRLFVDF
jgi:porin